MIWRICRLLLVSSVGLSISLPGHTWGKTGHRVTGQIAEQYLSEDARRAVEEILGPEDLAEASTWPDFMRAAPGDFWQRQANPWHYVTVPEGQIYAEAGAPEWGDAVTALDRFRKTLKSPDASRDDKALALRFIVHIVGDLHQPLHAGNGTDRGGNAFSVTFFRELTNLHSVWDTRMIDHEQLSYTEMSRWLLRTITPEQAESWRDTNAAVWIAESTEIRDRIYPEDRDLAWDYVFEHRDTYRTRLKMAGVRIAAYLNQTFEVDSES